MKIKPLVYDKSFFQTYKTTNYRFSGNAIEQQFKHITNYLNNKIITNLQKLITTNLTGFEIPKGYVLRNLGAMQSKFDKIKLNDLADYNINFSKIASPNFGIYAFNNNELEIIHSNDLYSLPFSSAPVNQVISFNNTWNIDILNNNIFGEKIHHTKIDTEAITKDHLASNFDISSIPKRNRFIQDKAILNRHIIDYSLNEDVFNNILLATRIPANLRFVKNGTPFIKYNHIAFNSLDFDTIFGNNKILTNNNIPENIFPVNTLNNISTYTFFGNGTLKLQHIQNGSFTPKMKKHLSKKKLSPTLYNKLKAVGLLT